MKIKSYLYKKGARIEILPLIDIVFLLLVFFIYAMLSMTVHKGLNVSLPDSGSAKIVRENAISITIMKDGSLYLEKKRVSHENIKAALTRKIGEENDPKILLFADKAVQFREIFSVLDKIRAAGVKRVSLQAKSSGRK